MRAQITLDSITAEELYAAQVAYQRTAKHFLSPEPVPGTPTSKIAVMGVAFTWESPHMSQQHMTFWAQEFVTALEERGAVTVDVQTVFEQVTGEVPHQRPGPGHPEYDAGRERVSREANEACSIVGGVCEHHTGNNPNCSLNHHLRRD